MIRNKYNKQWDTKIPALVLGSSITALGTIRSLGREGIPIIYINPNPDFVKYSRWIKRLPSNLLFSLKFERLDEFLMNFPFDKAVLYPCTDSYAKDCVNLSPELSEKFIATVPPEPVLSFMLDKRKFSEILSLYKIPHPHTIFLKNERSIKEALPVNLSEYFIKPTNSQNFFNQFGVKAFHINSPEEYFEQCKRLTGDGYELLLQEYIPGPPDQHYYIDGYVSKTDKERTFFARRRLRMYPPDFGNSTFLQSIPLKQVYPAAEYLDYLFSKTKFSGIFSAEFKWDKRDKIFKILEINARPWWYIEYATRCGVNVCKLAYDDVLGLVSKDMKNYQVNSYLAYPYYDYCAVFLVGKKSKINILSYVLTWIRSQTPFLTWSDPLPGVVTLFSRTMHYLKRRLKINPQIDNKSKS